MTDHCLNYLKGWFAESSLDFAAPMNPAVSISPVYGGSCVHVDSTGMFRLGCTSTQMPIFLIQGSQDFDVSNASPAGASPSGQWYGIEPPGDGNNSGLVATGGYELETTEAFNMPTVSYSPNQTLHSPSETQVTNSLVNGTKIGAGQLYANTAYASSAVAFTVGTQNICGVVSRASGQNEHFVNVCRFWPVYVQGSEAAS